MSERWRHVLCLGCYATVQPGRTPYLVLGAAPETCCSCGEPADPPVFYRAHPESFHCDGQHLPEGEADAISE